MRFFLSYTGQRMLGRNCFVLEVQTKQSYQRDPAVSAMEVNAAVTVLVAAVAVAI